MHFGFNFFARDLRIVPPIARLGEQLGFEVMGLADSPSLAFDPFIGLSLAAVETTRIRLGPIVTNPLTRHPLIIANLAAALEHLAPGRSLLGLGTGNSGVRHAGAGPATLETLAATVDVTRRLLAGDTVDLAGAAMTVKGGGHRVPILLTGSGPKTLRLAGRIADIVFMNVGVLPEVAADGLRWIQEGVESAGRSRDELEVWVSVPVEIGYDRAAALDAAKGAGLAVAAYALRGDPTHRHIPPGVHPKVAQLLRDYDYSAHLTPGRTTNHALAEQLGIADYLVDRFTIAGTPEDFHRKLTDLRSVGIDNVCLSVSAAPDTAVAVRLLGETVLPSLAG